MFTFLLSRQFVVNNRCFKHYNTVVSLTGLSSPIATSLSIWQLSIPPFTLTVGVTTDLSLSDALLDVSLVGCLCIVCVVANIYFNNGSISSKYCSDHFLECWSILLTRYYLAYRNIQNPLVMIHWFIMSVIPLWCLFVLFTKYCVLHLKAMLPLDEGVQHCLIDLVITAHLMSGNNIIQLCKPLVNLWIYWGSSKYMLWYPSIGHVAVMFWWTKSTACLQIWQNPPKFILN